MLQKVQSNFHALRLRYCVLFYLCLNLSFFSQVFGCLQKRGLTVTVLSDAPITEYKASDYLHGSDVPFLRALKTSANKAAVNCPFLEQPNIVTGLPAAGNFAPKPLNRKLLFYGVSHLLTLETITNTPPSSLTGYRKL